MKYTKERLNEYNESKGCTVCHIESLEQWEKLKELCPKINDYNEEYKYYLTSCKGWAKVENLYSEKIYKIIEFNELPITLEYEIY